jgi:hypothetical protein
MPYVKALAVNSKTNNASGCHLSVNYLEKENKDKSITEKEFFFNDTTNVAVPSKVEHDINEHKKGLKSTDSKYYEVVINFSKDELKGKSDKELKEYVKKEFPKAYTGAVNGKDIDEKQLTWYAKLERERKYKGTDKEVLEGKAKSGQMKEGDQRHFHVLIARKTKDEKHKISPLTNHRDTQKGVVKGGFERVKFAENIEKSFDKHFKYERSQEQSFQYRNEQKKGIKNEEIIKQQQEQINKKNKGLSI